MISGGSSEPYRILYVDDDPTMLALATAFFESDSRFTVICFSEADDAFEAFTSGTYDAIISDHDMPGITGLDLLRMVRDLDKEFPFIMVTGRSREEIVVLAIQAGVSYYLNKGIDAKSFFAELIHVTVLSILSCRAQRQVRESENLLRNLAEGIQGIIFRMSLPEGAFIYVSPGSTSTIGYTPEEMCANPRLIFEIIHPDWKNYLDQLWNGIISGDVPQLVKLPVIHRDGQTRWIRFNNTLVRDDKGEPVFLEAIVYDITREMETLTKLCEREQMYRILADSAHDIIVIIDLSGVIRYTNGYASAKLSTTPEELIGKTLHELFPETIANGMNKSVKLVITTGESLMVTRQVKFGGQDTWIESNIAPLRSEDGTIISVMIISRDITKRKTTEQKLTEQEDLYRTLFEVSNEAILIREIEGRILDGNEAACRMFGYSKEELLEQTCFDITGEQYRENYDEIVHLLETTGDTMIRLEGVRKDGSRFPIEATIKMIRYEGKRRVVSFVHDIPKAPLLQNNKNLVPGFIVIPQV
ncbi:MAG: PAS domain S-box protein [Methanospirillum sp.]|nr:PAS domain S-box protein [Methanospirillum sp.]